MSTTLLAQLDFVYSIKRPLHIFVMGVEILTGKEGSGRGREVCDTLAHHISFASVSLTARSSLLPHLHQISHISIPNTSRRHRFTIASSHGDPEMLGWRQQCLQSVYTDRLKVFMTTQANILMKYSGIDIITRKILLLKLL